jgi:ACS family tartrate transporter-like MFS transporter
MCLLYLVAFIDRISLGFAQLTMGGDLGVDPAMFGLISGIFFAGYILFELPSNVALERFGARIWLTRIGVTWGLVTIAQGFVQNETQLLIMRFLLGVAEAGLAPGLAFYIMRMYPRAYRARANSLIFIGAPIATALAGPICGVILDNVGWFDFPSWRWVFVLTGIPAVLLGIVTYTLLVDRPADARWLSTEQREWIVGELSRENAGSHHASHRILASFRNIDVLLLALVQFLISSGSYGLAFWSPQIVKGLAGDFSPTLIGLLVFVPYAAATVAMVVNAAHSDRKGEHPLHAAVPAAIGGIALVSLGIVSTGSSSVGFVLLVVAAAGVNAYGAPFWAIAQNRFAGPSAAVMIAAVSTLGAFGGLLAPYIFGLFTKFSGDTNSGVTYLGLVVILAAVILLAARKRLNQTEETVTPLPDSTRLTVSD